MIGPELDKVGANRSPEWLLTHFKNPSAVTPGSAMPPIKASEADLDALTLYVLSFTGEPLSAYYVSMKTIPGPPAGAGFLKKKAVWLSQPGRQGRHLGPALDEVAKRARPCLDCRAFPRPASDHPWLADAPVQLYRTGNPRVDRIPALTL